MSDVKKSAAAAKKTGAAARPRAGTATSPKPKRAQEAKAGAARAKADKPKVAAKADKPKSASAKVAKPKVAAKSGQPKPAAKQDKPKTAPKPGTASSRAQKPAAHAKKPAAKGASSNLFLDEKAGSRRKKGGASSSGRRPPKDGKALFGVANACLVIGIGVLLALGVRLEGQYLHFLEMREVVDQQTFYEGTTVEGVDVSKMTYANAVDYWRERVEPRYAGRTVALDDGETVTAGELGYASDYAAVLSAAWSAGRNGSLEERYDMASYRRENPVAYRVTRTDTSPEAVAEYVQSVAQRVNRPAKDASIASFDAENYEFRFNPSEAGQALDEEALATSLAQAVAAGGGSVALPLSAIEPAITTEDVESRYGLIDYAITNANSSSRARLNNIKLAMSLINGTRVAPGETFSFNETVGQRTVSRGFQKATAYSGGDVTEQVGGGICQVSTTLFNAAVKADMEIVERHNHSLTVSYVDKGKDATVDWGNQDFRFKNTSEDDVYICCYLTDDKRVRFGMFGRLLPNGEKITVDAVTTEMIKYETKYEATPLLAHGQTYLMQNGRNGYKAEAYKVRWDALGNQISRELLCKSVYQVKDEIIQYGA